MSDKGLAEGRAQLEAQLAREIARVTCVSVIECHSIQVCEAGVCWFDLGDDYDTAALELLYLDVCGALARHPHHAKWVRLVAPVVTA